MKMLSCIAATTVLVVCFENYLIKAVLTSAWKVGYRKIGRVVLFNLHQLQQSLDYRCVYYNVLSEISVSCSQKDFSPTLSMATS